MEIIDEMEREMIENLESFNRRGSNWVFERVIRLEIHFVRWNPLRGSSWIALPPDLENKKALINMKNEDHMCFKWCITRAKNQVEIHQERITPKLREQAEELNWDGQKSSNFSECFWLEWIYFSPEEYQGRKRMPCGFDSADKRIQNALLFGEEFFSLGFLSSFTQWT